MNRDLMEFPWSLRSKKPEFSESIKGEFLQSLKAAIDDEFLERYARAQGVK